MGVAWQVSQNVITDLPILDLRIEIVDLFFRVIKVVFQSAI
jgi:hypothetical protein